MIPYVELLTDTWKKGYNDIIKKYSGRVLDGHIEIKKVGWIKINGNKDIEEQSIMIVPQKAFFKMVVVAVADLPTEKFEAFVKLLRDHRASQGMIYNGAKKTEE